MKATNARSFSATVKEELIRMPAGRACCMLSEISALTQTSGHLSFRGGGCLLSHCCKLSVLHSEHSLLPGFHQPLFRLPAFPEQDRRFLPPGLSVQGSVQALLPESSIQVCSVFS